MRTPLVIGTVLAVAAWGCGGETNGGSMTMPTPGSGVSSPNGWVVTIVGQQGMLSFSPNPVQIPQGETVVWRNADETAHRIVMNDGSFDSGIIAPGASSPPMRLGTMGGAYHCTVHPAMMFGSIVADY